MPVALFSNPAVRTEAMAFSAKSVILKLTAAIVIDGNIVRAGTLVEMMDGEAKDLLRRGKAVLADEPAEQHNEGSEDDHQVAAEAAAAAATEAAAEATHDASEAAADDHQAAVAHTAKPAATRKAK